MHVQDGYAYYTNTGQQVYARTPVDGDGVATGPSEVLAKGAGIPAPDDFALVGADGVALVTDATLSEVLLVEGGSAKPVASVSTRPTAVRAKNGEEGTWYVSSAGNATVGGAIYQFVLTE